MKPKPIEAPVRGYRTSDSEAKALAFIDLGGHFTKATEQTLEVRTNIHCHRLPEARLQFKEAETKLEDAKKDDREKIGIAAIEQNRTPAPDMDFGPDLIVETEDHLAKVLRVLEGVKSADTLTAREWRLALRKEQPNIAKRYNEWITAAANIDPMETTLAESDAIRSKAATALPILKPLYTISIEGDSPTLQEIKRLNALWDELPEEMPTLEDVRETLRGEAYDSPGAVKARADETLKRAQLKERQEEVAQAARFRSATLTGDKVPAESATTPTEA